MKELRKVYYEVIIWQLARSVSKTNDTLRHSTRGWGSPVTITEGIIKQSLQIQYSTSCYRPTADCSCFWRGCVVEILYEVLVSFMETRGQLTVKSWFNLFDAGIIFLILAHPVYKMWIIQEPNMLELWNKRHFEEKKRRVYTMFKILRNYICWIHI